MTVFNNISRDGSFIPDHPSKKLGIQSQPVLIEMSHKPHRGRYGVNDSEMMEDSEFKQFGKV